MPICCIGSASIGFDQLGRRTQALWLERILVKINVNLVASSLGHVCLLNVHAYQHEWSETTDVIGDECS